MPNGVITATSDWLQWILVLRQSNLNHTSKKAVDKTAFFFILLQKKITLGRILAIDYGQKRTGLAATDPLQIIANSIGTVPSSEVISFLKNYTVSEKVDAFVVGYPRQMNNTLSESVKYIDPFIASLKKAFPGINVYLMDERFTSKMAVQTMIAGGVKKKDRQNKSLIDSISATIILQSFMEQKGRRSEK
jgi:putative Holliday junction resolvase